MRLFAGGTQRRFPPKYIDKPFQTTHSTFRSLEMHSKRRYNNFICSVMLKGNLRLFEITKASVLFSRKSSVQLQKVKVRIFLTPLSITFLNPKILGFLFTRKLALHKE